MSRSTFTDQSTGTRATPLKDSYDLFMKTRIAISKSALPGTVAKMWFDRWKRIHAEQNSTYVDAVLTFHSITQRVAATGMRVSPATITNIRQCTANRESCDQFYFSFAMPAQIEPPTYREVSDRTDIEVTSAIVCSIHVFPEQAFDIQLLRMVRVLNRSPDFRRLFAESDTESVAGQVAAAVPDGSDLAEYPWQSLLTSYAQYGAAYEFLQSEVCE